MMTYEDMIKEFKKDILEMDVRDEEFVTKLEVSKKYETYGTEEVTVHITYKKGHEPDYGRRFFQKPIQRPEPARDLAWRTNSDDTMLFEAGTTFTNTNTTIGTMQ